jgi:hypothetical protein
MLKNTQVAPRPVVGVELFLVKSDLCLMFDDLDDYFV